MLRKEFQIGALEARHSLPAWERRMLLRQRNKEIDREREEVSGG